MRKGGVVSIMLLGELLILDGVVTRAQIEEALEAQVLHGGHIGTNLVELGYITEAQLASALGRQHRVHFAHGAIVPSPDALALLDPGFADDKDVLPVRLEGNRLYLLVVDPNDIETCDAVARTTGKRVVPVVVAEFRMAQLQRCYCKAFRPVREVDIEAMRRKREAPKQVPEAPAADLMSEDDFQSLYAAAMRGQAVVPLKEQARAQALIIEGVPEIELQPADVVPIERAPSPQPIEPPKAPAPVPMERRRRDRRPARPDDARPIGFAEAQKALASISDREDIARIVLRFAAGKFKRALLLQVQREGATGWLGAGAGLALDAVRHIAVSFQKPSAFKLVRESRSHYLGPLRRDVATVFFLKALGGKEPRSALLMPLLAAGRVVNILYADSGPDQFTSPDVGELLILAQSVGRSFEAMIAARRKVMVRQA